MFGKLFNNLKNGLTKTKNVLTDKINETLKKLQSNKISEFVKNHKVIFDYLFKSSYMPV